MAYKDSKFLSLDNTGVKEVKCLKVFKQNKARPASLVTVVLKKVLSNRKVKKGQIHKAVVVRLQDKVVRYFGYTIRFDMNCVVLLKKNEMVPLGTRILGAVFYELRLGGYLKIVALSSYLI